MSQHGALTPERWRQFSPDQRLLMIANEMLRVSSALTPERATSRTLGYERVLRLTELTAGATESRGLRRELLRWREIVADLFLSEAAPERHSEALRTLLLLWPGGAEQLRALEGRPLFVRPEG